MLVGAIGASLRSVPLQILLFLENQFTLRMTVSDENDSFNWVKYWYYTQPHNKKSRRVDFDTYIGQTRFSLSPGSHWIWYKKRPIRIVFNRSDEKKGGYSAKRTESFSLQTLGRSQQYFRTLTDEMRQAYYDTFEKGYSLLIWDISNRDWVQVHEYAPRSLDSVIISEEQKARILADITIFRNSAEWYAEVGVPYHRGYLLYGLPGTGKTSLVTGLSSHFKSKVYVLNLSAHSDSSLSTAMRGLDKNSFLVLEDVDCVSSSRKTAEGLGRKEEKEEEEREYTDKKNIGVTLSGLLNALDGLHTPTGVIYFLTTNHIDKLDSALIRPGRVDMKEHIGAATNDQKATMHKRFFPTDDEGKINTFIESSSAITTAEYQEALMRERNTRLTGTKILVS